MYTSILNSKFKNKDPDISYTVIKYQTLQPLTAMFVGRCQKQNTIIFILKPFDKISSRNKNDMKCMSEI